MKRIQDFLQGNHIQFEEETRASYEQKLSNTQHSVSKKLLETAIAKKSNLIALQTLQLHRNYWPLQKK